MGGGIRSAAKLAGASVLNPVAAAARKATRAVASVVSPNDSGDDLKVAVEVNSPVRIAYPDMDDWDFSEPMEAREPLPRLVFGCAPTIQEAIQATSELNDALEIAYLSPNNTNRLEDSSDSENKPCLVSETAVTPSAPNQTLEAFRFLHGSPAACNLNVVASIATDPDVWGAVMQNEALVNFLHSHKTSAEPNLNDLFVCNEIPSPGSAKGSEEGGKGFMDYVVEVKQSVVEMMNGLSGYLQSLLGGPTKENYSLNGLSEYFQSWFGGPTKENYSLNDLPEYFRSWFGGPAAKENCSLNGDGISMEKATVGASLMGLAIMVIMVVILRRPA